MNDDPYALYRYFDVRDIELYVGISGELAVRDKSHISRSSWMQLAARSSIERRKTLEEVKRAEQEAIETEQPIFNIQYNNTPEARERLRAYLDEIGRLDLLTSKMRAAIEQDRRLQEAARRAHAAAAATERAPAEDPYWADWERRQDRWWAEAEGTWWRPWLASDRASEPDDMLSMYCPVYTAAQAEDNWRWECRLKEEEGWAWPFVYASSVQSWDGPDESSLFGFREQWSVRVDNRCAIPWENFTAETAAVQDALVDALVAAGRCTGAQRPGQVDLDGFVSKNEARVAGAVFKDLAWGHTGIAGECIALLKESALAESAI